MIKEFLLHKDKEKGNPPHIQAHLVFADTQSYSEKPKEPSFCRLTDRPLIIQALFILKNAILKFFDYFSGLIILTK
jgi:hypothetical protein